MAASPPRSVLAVPAASEAFLASSRRRAADALMIDLEDGVAPEAKEVARRLLDVFLREPAPVPAVWVRINEFGSRDVERDLAVIGSHESHIAALVLPKATTAAVLHLTRATSLPVVALVETAQGVEQSAELSALPGVAGVMFGSVDYVADVSRHGGWHLQDLSWVESRVVNATAAAGLWAIAGPRLDLAGSDGVVAAVRSDRAHGFAGKLCIHPRQLRAVNTGFAPQPGQLAWARRVLDATGDRDTGAVSVDGRMVDRPLLERARRLLAADEPGAP